MPNQDSCNRIAALQASIGLDNPESVDKLHMTIIYSRRDCPRLKLGEHDITPVDGSIIGFKIFGDDKNILVAEIECANATKFHSYLKNEHGATHDFKNYIPHITLTTTWNKTTIPTLPGAIKLQFDRIRIEHMQQH